MDDIPSSPTRRDMRAYHHRPKFRLKTRWLVLLLICLVMIGTYYSLDIPAALHHQLQDLLDSSSLTDTGVSATLQQFEFKFNLLFSVYSIPNTILPFFGGSCVDRVGTTKSLLSFAFLVLLGQILVTIGAFLRSWPLMLAGRFVYGLGGENVCVASSTVLNAWFDGGEVALAFAISLATGRLGSVINNVVSPFVANSISTPVAIGCGVLVNVVAFIAAIIVGFVEKRERRRRDRNAISEMLGVPLLAEAQMEEEPGASNDQTLNDYGDSINILGEDTTRVYSDDDASQTYSDQTLSGTCSFGPLFWLLSLSCMVVYGCVLPFNNVASGILMERNYFMEPPAECTLKYSNRCTAGTLLPDSDGANPSTFDNGTSCPLANVAPILPTTLNITRDDNNTDAFAWKRPVYEFSNLSQSDVDCGDPFWSTACTANFCNKQNEATETAGKIMSIPYTISALLSPLMGFLVDMIGGRAIIATLASVMLVLVHTALAIRTGSPLYPLIGQGIAYSLYAAVIWPSVPLTVRPQNVGTAFGIIMSIQNIGLTVFPMVIAAIHNYSGDRYVPNCEWFFVACAGCGVVAGLILNLMDCCSGDCMLNRRTPKDKGDDDVNSRNLIHVDEDGSHLEALDLSSLVSNHSTTLL